MTPHRLSLPERIQQAIRDVRCADVEASWRYNEDRGRGEMIIDFPQYAPDPGTRRRERNISIHEPVDGTLNLDTGRIFKFTITRYHRWLELGGADIYPYAPLPNPYQYKRLTMPLIEMALRSGQMEELKPYDW